MQITGNNQVKQSNELNLIISLYQHLKAHLGHTRVIVLYLEPQKGYAIGTCSCMLQNRLLQPSFLGWFNAVEIW